MRKPILPPRLKRGDTIGIVSPSSPATDAPGSQFERGIAMLESLGFRTKLAPNALSCSLGYSASAQEKADDINQMFTDESVQAIICSQGGQNANGVLPLLDYELIAKYPKIFLGISDITVLLNGMYAKTGLVTFHGNDVIWGFGRDPSEYEVDAFLGTLLESAIGAVSKNSAWRTIRGHETVEGRLLGGNIVCLGKIAGTEYWPDFTDAILFLEDYGEESTAAVASYGLHHLDQVGAFRQIKGLLLGHYKTAGDIQLEDLVSEVAGKYDFPIVKCEDFGHNTPNTIFPVGGRVALDVDRAVLRLLGPYLK